MPRFVQRAEDYTPVVDVELQPLSESYGEPQLGFDRPHRSWLTLFYLGLCVVAACCLTLGFIGGEYFQGGRSDSVTSFTKCQNPSIRHEWRSLSKYEKNEYIQAVQCLSNTSSRLGINQTLYDDFPFVHSRSGEECMWDLFPSFQFVVAKRFKHTIRLHFSHGIDILSIFMKRPCENNAPIPVISGKS